LPVLVPVHVTPRARRDSVALAQDASGKPLLRVHVRAVPEAGKANAAVEAMLAEAFAVPARDVSVVRGATARHKLVRVGTT
jgi:uncharacterized protein (TIGR00251 family)